MSTFDSLNFNVNVTDNASVVLSNVEKRLSGITAQSLSLEKAQLSLNNANITATQGQISYENAVRRQINAKANLYIANENLKRAEATLLALKNNEAATDEQIASATHKVNIAKANLIKSENALINATTALNTARLTQSKQANSVAIAEKNLEAQTLRASKSATTASFAFSRFFSRLFTGAIIARYVGSFLSSVVEETGSYIENLNLLSVAYGETYQETVKWAVDLADGFGLATNEVVKFTGTFRQLATSMGLVKETADSITSTIIELGYDISALYNIGVEEAMEKLQSGLYSGYTRPMRALGIDVSQNQVDALFETNEALKHLNVSAMNLKQGDKVLARLLITMQAASNSFGTMNREINTLQSQIRILEGSWNNFKLAMGDLVHEPIKEALIYINALIIAITKVIRAFHQLQTTDDTFVAFSNLGEEVDEANSALGELSGKLAGFDKFNVLGQGGSKENSESAVTDALMAEIKKQQALYDERKNQFSNIENRAVEMGKAIVGWFLKVDEQGNVVFEDDMPQWTTQTKALGVALVALPLIALVGAGGKSGLFGSLKLALLECATTTKGLTTNTTLLGKAFSFILNHPIIIAITALLGVMIYLYKTNESFRESVDALFNSLSPLLNILGALVSNILTPIFGILKALIDGPIGWLLEKGINILNMQLSQTLVVLTPIAFALEAIAKAIQTILLGIKALFTLDFSTFGKEVKDIWTKWASVDYAKSSWNNFSNAFSKVYGFSDGGYSNANLIMTHENGKREWVGKAAGSSAIVNDTQMSDIMEFAVARGVYQANMASKQLNGSTTDDRPIVIQIDGRRVFEATRGVARRQGLDFGKA